MMVGDNLHVELDPQKIDRTLETYR